MNIFLDSNILYSSPFFTETFGRLLISLSEQKKVKLLISTVSFEETRNNYLKLIAEKVELINKEWRKVSKISNSKQKLDLPDIDSYKTDFEAFYESQFVKGTLILINFKNDILPELVRRSINRIKPFTEKKQEFRDAIIWLSYLDYIAENSLTNNVFITNNKFDFWDGEKKSLHPHLLQDTKDVIVYSGFEDFFSNDSTIQGITQQTEFKKWLDSTVLDANVLTQILKNQLWQQIKQSVSDKIDKLNPNKYFKDIDGVYFEYHYQRDELKMVNFNIHPISNFAIIQCEIAVDGTAMIYPREFYWKKEKINFSFIIKLSFNLDVTKKINLNQIESVSIKPIKSS